VYAGLPCPCIRVLLVLALLMSGSLGVIHTASKIFSINVDVCVTDCVLNIDAGDCIVCDIDIGRKNVKKMLEVSGSGF